LLLYGRQIEEGTLNRGQFLSKIGVDANTFRTAGDALGAKGTDDGLRFFNSWTREKLSFGPGAGLVLGVSVGTASLRAALFDANGWMYHPKESKAWPEQLTVHPQEFLDRLGDCARSVLQAAFKNQELLVDGALPFLGVSVAWPTPMDRNKKPVGPALAHASWRGGRTLSGRVAVALNLPLARSHALNDAHAAAIAIAYDRTRTREHVGQAQSFVEIVIRLSATISAATVIIERPPGGEDADLGKFGATSGFPGSTLISGMDGHAGEIAHLPVSPEAVRVRNEGLDPELGPLAAVRCSCTVPGQPMPNHLEAYAATEAISARIAPGKPIGRTIREITRTPDAPHHRRALEDVGELLGDALVGPVALLNPARITLTGALAVPTVERRLRRHLSDAHVHGTPPDLLVLPEDENQLVRATGAALAVLRQEVHRQLKELLGGNRSDVEARVQNLVMRLEGNPF